MKTDQAILVKMHDADVSAVGMTGDNNNNELNLLDKVHMQFRPKK